VARRRVLLMPAVMGLVLLASTADAVTRTSHEGAGGGREQAARRYTTHGVVEAMDRERQRLDIAHEAIPGFMGAMTMTFVAAAPEQLDVLSVGDRVHFTFSVEDRARLVIRSIGKDPRP